ncbi:hypothetical protein KAI56_00285 [Candidatus Parcubacteria bacterium]|nr:hypothetical protein [Candidatus Parcubacteria bacterium]
MDGTLIAKNYLDNYIFYVKLLNKEELIIRTKEQNGKDLEVLKTIAEFSDNKKASGQLKLLENEDLNFLDWSEVDFQELIDLIIDSKNNTAIDYLIVLLRRKEQLNDHGEHLLNEAMASLINAVMENELGEKFPEITEEARVVISCSYGINS